MTSIRYSRPRLAAALSPAAAPFRWLKRGWRGSLLLRITTITLVSSLIVLTVLGVSLLSKVTTGLMGAKEQTSIAEASAGLIEAQRIIEAAEASPTAPSPSRLVDAIVAGLGSQGGTSTQFDILLLAAQPGQALPERGTNLVSTSSIDPELRVALNQDQTQLWTYDPIRYINGLSVPGLLVGAPLEIPSLGRYHLYYLFPLTQEQQTLDLVRGAVLLTGALLLVLLTLIARLVTRLVVNPVREAARTAALLADGQLSERMTVRGEDELAQLATTFNEMAESLQQQIKQLEELSRVQQRFVADVSHELRTPLTTIRMAADLMFERRVEFDAATARAAELLQNQLDRFEELLVDLLEISRFDAGVAVLDLEACDVNALVARAVEQARPLATRIDTSLELVASPDPALVAADSRRINRVVRNLLDNAIEHSDGKGVVVTVGTNEDAVAICVRDYGLGLRPGESGLVFNRFWRADPARARTTGGTGLGLSIAFEDARLHGGWLEAWGEPGLGSNFRLTLPRVAREPLTRSPLPLVPVNFEAVESADSSAVRLDTIPGPASKGFQLPPRSGRT
ncbi:MAG: MtrAB system histidine kinase MtrB [Actinomycetota bacterium]|nr:MtrAB system histidine kinase MtrB [Actinomycetota bacterium]MDP2289155.1 MtrAB system histidine kinase MtrB [Actinomycetota bacterium]